MTTYKAIRGLTIQTVAGDPSTLIAGDIWYSSITRKIRGAKLAAGAWSSGGNLTVAKHGTGGAGTQTAALCIGGVISGGSPTDQSESYDGSTWTEGNNVSTAISYNVGIGSQTAALSCGTTTADLKDKVMSYDGTDWSESTAMNTGRGIAGGAGTQTAALMFGGGEPQIADVESWNGSAWTEVANLSGVRTGMAGFGETNTAAICAGGRPNPPISRPDLDLALTETWNGTSWTEGNDLNTARRFFAGSGITTAGIVFGGSTGSPETRRAYTEEYDGTSWAEVADLSAARLADAATSAPSSLSLAFAGQLPLSNATEEWTKATEASSFTSS